jgi:L-ribulose-5-phosphate 3-epimerase
LTDASSLRARIGFMQGRLSRPVGGRIQAFPSDHWQDEFGAADRHGFRIFEWTLEHERIAENPLMTLEGQRRIRALGEQHRLRMASLTGDCFMQAPFWKATGPARLELLATFEAVVDACTQVGATTIVVPLVDNGSLADRAQEDDVVATLAAQGPRLQKARVRIAFECDLPPAEVGRFIDRLPSSNFGINYDIGNSASLGFLPSEELAAYGTRVINVHVKDRTLGGTTVPLGTGHAQLPSTLALIRRQGYAGNFILQTARDGDGDDVGACVRYRDLTLGWLEAAR